MTRRRKGNGKEQVLLPIEMRGIIPFDGDELVYRGLRVSVELGGDFKSFMWWLKMKSNFGNKLKGNSKVSLL